MRLKLRALIRVEDIANIRFLYYYLRERGNDNTGAEYMKYCNKGKMLDIFEALKNDMVIERRGPDSSRIHMLELSDNSNGIMRGCVLHLRGDPTPQPVIDNESNILLWNGEIFNGIKMGQHDNDTSILSKLLSDCSSDEDVLRTFDQVHGPWSFIYWQASKKTLWFGRDMYGRRSLLWHLPSDQSLSLVITSVAVGDLEYTEIPAVGIFSIDFSNKFEGNTKRQIEVTLHPWLQCRWPGTTQIVSETNPMEFPSLLKFSTKHLSVSIAKQQILQSWIPTLPINIRQEDISTSSDSELLQEDAIVEEGRLLKLLETIYRQNVDLRALSEKLVSSLHAAVDRRLNNLSSYQSAVKPMAKEGVMYSRARIAVLFSGGLDSSILAALADRCVPLDEPIDLLNVAFEQPPPESVSLKQRQKPRKKPKELSKVEVESSLTEPSLSSSLQEISLPDVGHIAKLAESSSLSEDWRKESNLNASHGASAVSESHIESRKNTTPSSATSTSSSTTDFNAFNVPDRQTGKTAYNELCQINPSRKWNFVEINVSQEELRSERKSRIRKLIYPLCTVLDDSIGCALWFAARGEGKLSNSQEQTVVSKAKVILCGMAADEQFAGYSRHRVHFKKFGWEGLISQLQQEMWRISQRNLGRDDRIISDHGKEARFPFLDESFTKFVSDIPVNQRADLRLPRGIGEKLLLRLSALSLGFRLTACHAKRAIQFGSKIAKIDKSKKGSDLCQRLID